MIIYVVAAHNRFHYNCCDSKKGITVEDVKALSIMNVAKRRRSRHRGTSPLAAAAAPGQTNHHPQVLVDDAETCSRDSDEGPPGGGATRPLLDINRRPSDSTSANSETQNCKCRISIQFMAVQ